MRAGEDRQGHPEEERDQGNGEAVGRLMAQWRRNLEELRNVRKLEGDNGGGRNHDHDEGHHHQRPPDCSANPLLLIRARQLTDAGQECHAEADVGRGRQGPQRDENLKCPVAGAPQRAQRHRYGRQRDDDAGDIANDCSAGIEGDLDAAIVTAHAQ